MCHDPHNGQLLGLFIIDLCNLQVTTFPMHFLHKFLIIIVIFQYWEFVAEV
jgi:hypothetical protein